MTTGEAPVPPIITAGAFGTIMADDAGVLALGFMPTDVVGITVATVGIVGIVMTGAAVVAGATVTGAAVATTGTIRAAEQTVLN